MQAIVNNTHFLWGVSCWAVWSACGAFRGCHVTYWGRGCLHCSESYLLWCLRKMGFFFLPFFLMLLHSDSLSYRRRFESCVYPEQPSGAPNPPGSHPLVYECVRDGLCKVLWVTVKVLKSAIGVQSIYHLTKKMLPMCEVMWVKLSQVRDTPPARCLLRPIRGDLVAALFLSLSKRAEGQNKGSVFGRIPNKATSAVGSLWQIIISRLICWKKLGKWKWEWYGIFSLLESVFSQCYLMLERLLKYSMLSIMCHFGYCFLFLIILVHWQALDLVVLVKWHHLEVKNMTA